MTNIIPEEFKNYFKIKNDDVILFGAYKGGRNLIKACLIMCFILIIALFVTYNETGKINIIIPIIILSVMVIFSLFLYLSKNNEVILDKKEKKITLHWRKKPQKDKTYSWENIDVKLVKSSGGEHIIYSLRISQKSPYSEIYSLAPNNGEPEVTLLMEFIEDFMEGNPIKEQYFKKE